MYMLQQLMLQVNETHLITSLQIFQDYLIGKQMLMLYVFDFLFFFTFTLLIFHT
jgi:hypothetical protein